MVIAFVGSVFSPYHARARRRATPQAPVDPQQHVAMNIALSCPGQPLRRSAWTMTERGAGALDRGPQHLAIGPSAWRWTGQALDLTLDERGLPWPLPSRVQGRVRVHPLAADGPGTTAPVALDAAGRHHWWPIAPLSRVEVDLPLPGWRWRGTGYLDSNRGDEPIEQGFARWQWARTALDRRHAAVQFDLQRRDGSAQALAWRFGVRGAAEPLPPPPMQPLARSGWRLPRSIGADPGGAARVLHTLHDAPFYARSLVQSRWLGQDVQAMHESLDLDRFQHPVVQAMLPFRMPRRGG